MHRDLLLIVAGPSVTSSCKGCLRLRRQAVELARSRYRGIANRQTSITDKLAPVVPGMKRRATSDACEDPQPT
jgi:hypothetical protein